MAEQEQESQDFWGITKEDTDSFEENVPGTEDFPDLNGTWTSEVDLKRKRLTSENLYDDASKNVKRTSNFKDFRASYLEPKTKRYKRRVSQADAVMDGKKTTDVKQKGQRLVQDCRELQENIETLLKDFRRRTTFYLKAVNGKEDAEGVIEQVDEIMGEIKGSVKGTAFDFRHGIIEITKDAVMVKAFD